MNTCTRNLPQHFNGCTCARTSRAPAEAAVTLEVGGDEHTCNDINPTATEDCPACAVEAAEAAWAMDTSSWDGSGWGEHRPVRLVQRAAEVAVGDVLAMQDHGLRARNLYLVTEKRTRLGSGTVLHGHFVDPDDVTRKRFASDGDVAVWDFQVEGGGYFATDARVEV